MFGFRYSSSNNNQLQHRMNTTRMIALTSHKCDERYKTMNDTPQLAQTLVCSPCDLNERQFSFELKRVCGVAATKNPQVFACVCERKRHVEGTETVDDDDDVRDENFLNRNANFKATKWKKVKLKSNDS